MPDLTALFGPAKDVLILRDAQGRPDLWLWEHTQRVTRIAQMIAKLPEVGAAGANILAVTVAALFHDAGWALQARERQVDNAQLLARPTNDIQRELGAAILLEQGADLLPGETLELAVEAIRQCNDRYTELTEARILAEAENLEDIGIAGMLRTFRQYQAEGRPLDQLLSSWARQREYRYWDARINDCLRYESTRKLARDRLGAVESFMAALASEQEGNDLSAILEAPPGRRR